MIRMEDLRNLFEGLLFSNVVSYINSGNLAFDHRRTSEASLEKTIETAVESHVGKPVQVMVREQEAIGRILANNPFEGQYGSHKEMHVLFLKKELSEENMTRLSEAVPPNERFVIQGREIYCHLPLGVAESYLGRGQFEKKLKISVTARNWRTVEKLAVL